MIIHRHGHANKVILDGITAAQLASIEANAYILRALHYGDPELEPTPDAAFTFDSATKLITGYTGTHETIVVPWEIDGVAVEGVADKTLPEGVFSSITSPNTSLKKIYFPLSCEYLGDGCCIGASNLERARGHGVTELGASAFDSCSSLSVGKDDLPNAKTFGVEAFNETGDGTIVLPSAETLGNTVFTLAANKRAVVFGSDAPTAGTNIFEDSPEIVVYRLAGTSGWGATFEGRPVVTVERLDDAYNRRGILDLGEVEGTPLIDGKWCRVARLSIGNAGIDDINAENLDEIGVVIEVDNTAEKTIELPLTNVPDTAYDMEDSRLYMPPDEKYDLHLSARGEDWKLVVTGPWKEIE